MKRTLSILTICLAASLMSNSSLNAQSYAYDAVIYISEDGTIVLACADDGQAAFMSIADQRLLVGSYKIADDYNSFMFLAKDAKGSIYAKSEFKILSEDMIQEVNTGVLFYRQ